MRLATIASAVVICGMSRLPPAPRLADRHCAVEAAVFLDKVRSACAFPRAFPHTPKTDSMHRSRSHPCGALRDRHIGETVRLSGWVHRVRDHGGVLFIDLRDHYGRTQVVADPDSPAFKAAETLRAEWVVRVDGKVRRRPGGTENSDLPTGAVEVYVRETEVL